MGIEGINHLTGEASVGEDTEPNGAPEEEELPESTPVEEVPEGEEVPEEEMMSPDDAQADDTVDNNEADNVGAA